MFRTAGSAGVESQRRDIVLGLDVPSEGGERCRRYLAHWALENLFCIVRADGGHGDSTVFFRGFSIFIYLLRNKLLKTFKLRDNFENYCYD